MTNIPHTRVGRTGPDTAKRLGFLCLALAVLALAPSLVYTGFLMKTMCFAMFAMAFNLLFGFGGLLSFGHAAYFGIGAYVTGHAAKVWGLSPELAILVGTATGGLLGVAFGWLAIRRQGIYFAMITLALSQMVFFFALQAPFTGGENGLQSVPRGMLFGLIDLRNTTNLYAFIALVFLASFLFVRRVVNSPFGQLLRAVRENETRAISLGYDTVRVKHIAFILSATLAGLAGSLKVLVAQLASLTDVHWAMSGEVVLMTLIGGMGTLFGPVIGAVIVIAMQNYLAGLGSWVLMIQGAIFVFCVLALRGGIVGILATLWTKLSRR